MCGHLAISKLLQLYMTHNLQYLSRPCNPISEPLRIANASAAYLIEDLLGRAACIRQHGLHMAASNEKTAAQIAAQEVVREYGLYLLAKLRIYWLNAYGSNAQVRSAYRKAPIPW